MHRGCEAETGISMSAFIYRVCNKIIVTLISCFPLYSPLRCFCVFNVCSLALKRSWTNINHTKSSAWTIPGKTLDQRAIILHYSGIFCLELHVQKLLQKFKWILYHLLRILTINLHTICTYRHSFTKCDVYDYSTFLNLIEYLLEYPSDVLYCVALYNLHFL